jgi:uncharacterized protein YecE (DUF72 family)
VYHTRYPASGATARMLGEYARWPLFRTVGIDSTFYRPPTAEMLDEYAAELPDGFECVSKVWDRITIHTFGRSHPGAAGHRNEDFLNADLFCDAIYDVYRDHFSGHAGPFVFEFQAIPRSARLGVEAFAELLDRFFNRLPRGARYAVEIRNPEFLAPPYFAVLREHDVAHVFNSWTHMPPIGQQLDLPDSLTTSFTVCRALLRPGRADADARAALEPFDRVHTVEPEVRRDIVRLAKATLERDADSYIVINNRLEGCAPLTVEALAATLLEADA